MIKNCVLCDGLKDEFQNIKEQYPELQSNVTLFETKSFKVIPDKFPIAPNHIIILPKEHINTFAEFNDAQGQRNRLYIGSFGEYNKIRKILLCLNMEQVRRKN